MAVKTSRASLTSIGDHVVLEKIGSGGAGAVYKCRHRPTGRIVAVKLLAKELAEQPRLVRRFEQEFLAARSLDHPHIVRGLDFGIEGTTPYLVMEYVEGENLGDRIARCGRLPEAEAVRLICQVGSALQLAHQRKLIHRDVKPDNIVLTAGGDAKLTDLGLVKNAEADLNLTQTQSMLGTPNFMAPEQFQDAKRVDARCDVYSLGATLYMAVTGELPFRTRSHRNLMAILKKKLEDDLPPPRQLVPGLSQHTDLAIRRAMRARLEQRFATCQEFLDALTGASHPGERRQAVRHPANLDLSCQLLVRVKEKEWPARAVNVSARGVCLVLGRRFEPGTHLTVQVRTRDGDLARTLVLRVVRVSRQPPKEWTLGCVLTPPLNDPDLKDLL
jgi:eukaryotic-like serine/threonine-protein kinase